MAHISTSNRTSNLQKTLSAPTPNSSASSSGLSISTDDHGIARTIPDQSLGDAILSEYASHVGLVDGNEATHQINGHIEPVTEELTPTSSHVAIHPTSKPSQQPANPPIVQVRPSFPFRTHRKSAHSLEIPQQTIMKALASRSGSSPNYGPHPPLANVMNSLKSSKDEQVQDQPTASSSMIASLDGPATNGMSTLPPTADWLLKLPCFFHKRLEGLVDMQKVIEDMTDEDYTHSRLMQTATVVRESARHLQRRPLKQAVRNVMIVTKARDHQLVQLTRELAEWLLSTPRYGKELGVKVYVDAKLRHSRRFDAPGLLKQNARYSSMLQYWTPDLCWSRPEIFDLVLTLGGDGTVLFTSWLFQRIVPPILSFSMGSLGFLTNFAFDDYKNILTRAIGDQGMLLNLRMRFTCTVWRAEVGGTSTTSTNTSTNTTSPSPQPQSQSRPQPHTTASGTSTTHPLPGAAIEGEQFEVLNELVIDRGPSPYVSNLELWENSHLLTIIQADGCIFSTPTGSTAYSLSAGGALVSPEIPAVLLTPICPHTLSFRPMLLSDTVSLRICVPRRSRASVYCSFDGRGRVELKRGDYVTLEASQYPFPTVMRGRNEWLESVQRKLMWNTRGGRAEGVGGGG